jgi:arylsulfatase A-like enzyme
MPVRVGGLIALLMCVVAHASALERPNIVILLADDLGYGELSCQGNPEIPTPYIDSIAAQGVRFTSGYVTAPFCAASRAGLITGRYQTRFGFEFNPIGARNADPAIGLPPITVTLAERLHDAGYATGLIGKWHLGGTAAYHPLRSGFDEFFGFLHEGHYYVPPDDDVVTTWLRRKALPDSGQGRWTSPDGRLILSTHLKHDEPAYDADNPLLRGSQPVAETEYLTDAFTREAISFIVRNRHRPFCLFVTYNAVHSPMQASPGDLRRFEHIEDIHRRMFAAMLHRLDVNVEGVLRALREAGVAERTLVWFLSDNGGPTRELTSSNTPLRGGKGELYEGGIRVPFLLRWPGVAPAGRVESRAVSSLDIAATSLAAAGVELDAAALDGVDLRPWLMSERSDTPHSELYWRVGERAALRQGDWKLVRSRARRQAGSWELYDLSSDLAETHDLAETNPERREAMVQAWDKLDAEMVPPLWEQ